MSSFLQHLQDTPLLCDGAMGSLLFERTGRLSEQNHLYETFNADNPDLIRDVHLEYLQAGATTLITNTFAANHTHLAIHDQADRVEELNRQGVLVAREAIDQYNPQRSTNDPFFVIGSIGPTLEVRESPQEVRAVYQPQIEALIGAGVDALLFETFTSLLHVSAVLDVVHSLPKSVPVVVQMSLHQQANDSWDLDPLLFAKTAADLHADVLGVNCCAPWEAQAFLKTVSELESVKAGQIQLSLMPNGGDFQRIGHRYLTGVNPEFMGRFARQSAQCGAHLLGGCCDVYPAHINEMHNYLRSLHKTQIQSQIEWDHAGEPTPIEIKRDNGPFSQKIFNKEFAVSVELLPSRGTGGIKARMQFIQDLAASGLADALDLTDGSRGIPLMPPGDFIHLIRQRLGWKAGDELELIPHFTLRDLNTMGLQSRLIGYWANQIHNVLLITGDPPKMSPTYPRSSAVFDMDSTTLIRYVQNYLNAGIDFGGQKLGSHRDPRTRFTVGTGFEPEALDMESEIEKLQRKLEARVDYIMTQPVFNHTALDTLAPFRKQSAVLIGVLILANADHARRMATVPGMVIPDEVLARLARFDKAEDQAAAGVELAAEQVQRIRREGWSGVYLMSPASHSRIIDVLREGMG